MAKWIERIELADLWDAFSDDRMPFEQVRDQIVQRLHASLWAKRKLIVRDLIDDYLAVADDTEEFDDAWHSLLDMANTDHIWLETILINQHVT